ncbi:MAG: DUF4114 domain-containing protein [Geminicoccaceae bacterium]|nr:DUF4114 domain-containing protein [Geminicoccaceae bacterium]
MSLVVSTLDDVVDASDGVLSLREAVTLANTRSGHDTITIADDIRGGTLQLNVGRSGGTLEVTDDLAIDGGSGSDPRTSIRSEGEYGSLFRFEGVSGHIEDLTLLDRSDYGSPLVSGSDAQIELQRVDISGYSEFSMGLAASGGSLAIIETTVDVSGQSPTGISTTNGTKLEVIDSYVTIDGEGATAVDGDGTAVVTGSTVEARGNYSSLGIEFSGDVTMTNSTIVAVSHSAFESYASASDRAFVLKDGGSAALDHVTIMGSEQPIFASDDQTGYLAIEVQGGASLVLENSLVVGDHGTLTSTGNVTDGGGNVLSDRDGVSIADVFATGELADNGGPTPTLALLDGSSNPAVGAAVPSGGDEVDQRGFARDVAPDAGAFEAGAGSPLASPLPELHEKVAVAEADINGAERSDFVIGASGDAIVTFMDEYAGYQSTLGVYLVGENDTIGDVRIVFDRIEHAQASDEASASARPGGGPLDTGDSVALSELYDADQLQEGTEFGLFLISDGTSRNDASVFDSGHLEFRDGDGAASLSSTTPELVHVAGDGSETAVSGSVMHFSDADDDLANVLNPGGGTQVISGLLDTGETVLGIEDKPLARSDADFNDIIIAVDTSPSLDILVAAETVTA